MKAKNIKQIIKEYFFVNPTARLRVRQIERNIKVPLPSAIKYAKELDKEGILKKTSVANIALYSADRTSRKFLVEKMLFNIKSIYTSGLFDYLIIEYSNPLIVLFGSYAKGEDIENSDIDIYLQTPAKKLLNLEKFEKLLERKIQIFNYNSIKSVENKELANSIINGIVLNGFLEVF